MSTNTSTLGLYSMGKCKDPFDLELSPQYIKNEMGTGIPNP